MYIPNKAGKKKMQLSMLNQNFAGAYLSDIQQVLACAHIY